MTLEGKDERLDLGLPSSSRRSEEDEDKDEAGPRLLRWEMRAFFGAKGSMKSKSDWRFCKEKKKILESLIVSILCVYVCVYISVCMRLCACRYQGGRRNTVFGRTA